MCIYGVFWSTRNGSELQHKSGLQAQLTHT